ncbi:MarR family winged helix-turn-helix transcriptional regulator [soil metagenome]
MADHGTPAGLAGRDLETWAALATVLEWLPPALDAQLKRDADLAHFEYGVLFALARAPERTLRMSVLADYSNSTLSRLSRAVTRLEQRGWVRRSVDPGDGRFTLATLTDAGARQYELATPGHEENVRALVLDALTARQREQLLAISRTIATRIRPGGGWSGAHSAVPRLR